MAATLTLLGNLKDQALNNVSIDQVSSSAVFGSGMSIGDIKYDSSATYNTGDVITYTDSNGNIKFYECIGTNVTGAFDPSKWEEYSIIGKTQALQENLIVLSETKPTDSITNKVWLEIK